MSAAAMRAFTAPAEVSREALLASLAAHREAGRLVQQHGYWSDGRGCAVGCTLRDFAPGREYAHAAYETLFGVPVALAHLEDAIFEGSSLAAARRWPERFVRSIEPGADLTAVADRWLLWLLSDAGSPLAEWRDEPWMAGVADLYRRRLAAAEPGREEWAAAWAARDAARAAAWAAARDAARAAWAARDAARAAAWAAMADALVRLIADAPAGEAA
ncbi:hypothetical protein [Candidatus Palauibacter sp.]|uniref:hypothetical protein n=1 Tax=Candidatus Palauibacter sp. TaxID=3101350 RepID=UPI003CC651C1